MNIDMKLKMLLAAKLGRDVDAILKKCSADEKDILIKLLVNRVNNRIK
mgnify:CR=1 FL=1